MAVYIRLGPALFIVRIYLIVSYSTRFIADQDLFSTPANTLRTIGWSLAIPVWRSTHFYFAHRLIHIRVLYKYVHSLHHRNIDIEPFSGTE
jgi:sterol desaturase/sphingolipid hydroxylase (fatty acid hydroxylase superfamily)